MEIFITIIADAFQTYCQYLMMKCFFDLCKFSPKVEFICYCISMLMTTIPHMLFRRLILTVLFSLITYLAIAFIYKGSVRKSIFVGLFSYVTMVFTESMVAASFGYLYSNFFTKQNYFSLFGTVCLPIVEYLLIRIIQNLKNLKAGQDIPISYWLVTIGLPPFSLTLYILFYKQLQWNKAELVIFVVIFFVLNILVFYLYDKQMQFYRIENEKNILELQNEYQLNQLKLVNEMGEKAREQRHDFLRHVSMISRLIGEKRYEEVESYIAEVRQNIEVVHKYVDSSNECIDSILNYKIQEAIGKGIDFDATVKVPKDMNFSLYDMNVLLSNLIDNSIEAVSSMEEKRITFHMYLIKNKLYIEISNPYKQIEKNRDGSFKTTKKDKRSHGYGLKNVNNIASKYEGVIKIDTQFNVFKVVVCLFI